MGAIKAYPNEDALLTYANKRLTEASGASGLQAPAPAGRGRGGPKHAGVAPPRPCLTGAACAIQ